MRVLGLLLLALVCPSRPFRMHRRPRGSAHTHRAVEPSEEAPSGPAAGRSSAESLREELRGRMAAAMELAEGQEREKHVRRALGLALRLRDEFALEIYQHHILPSRYAPRPSAAPAPRPLAPASTALRRGAPANGTPPSPPPT